MQVGTWAFVVKGASGFIARGKYVDEDALDSKWRTRVQSFALLWGSVENVARIARLRLFNKRINARLLWRGDATVTTRGLYRCCCATQVIARSSKGVYSPFL
ncbi:unnamed protein product [Ascophyllum nodosum]